MWYEPLGAAFALCGCLVGSLRSDFAIQLRGVLGLNGALCALCSLVGSFFGLVGIHANGEFGSTGPWA